MPRPLRPIADGLIYHVINRGNNRQNVFRKEADFQAFLQALADLKTRKPFELYGYCLMGNHFHLLLRPGEVTISRIVQSLLVSHTQRYHKHHRSGGHVWQGRFKSPVIENDAHLLNVLRYIEANPLRAELVCVRRGLPLEQLPRSRIGGSQRADRPPHPLRRTLALPGRAAAQMGREGSPAPGRTNTGGDSAFRLQRPTVRRPQLGAPAGQPTRPRPYDSSPRPPAEGHRQ